MWTGLLPIGSVVSLYGSDMKFIIVGNCILNEADKKKLFDYAACVFPQGFISADQFYMFNREDIDEVYCVGYLTPEWEKWECEIEKGIKGVRDGSIKIG